MGTGASLSQTSMVRSKGIAHKARLVTVENTKDISPSDQANSHEVNGKYLGPQFRHLKSSSIQRSFHSLISSSSDLSSFLANAEFLLQHTGACKEGKIVRINYSLLTT